MNPRDPMRVGPSIIVLYGLLTVVQAATAAAQSFVKVIDAANPIATLGAGPAASFIGSSWVDTDGDGDLDLFIVRKGLFRNDGAGTFVHLPFAIASQGLATGNTWADVENDGDVDCFIAGGTPNGSALYRNVGGNEFQKVITGVMADTSAHRGWAAAFADYDRDGWVDLVLAAPVGFNGVNGPNRLFHNDGAGNFTRLDTSTVATGLAFYTVPSWSDFDNDGDPDLFIGSGSGGGGPLPDNLYRNRHESSPGWFERYVDAPLGTDLHDGQLYNWIDYDNDGDLDVYLTNFGGYANDLYGNLGGGVFAKKTAGEVGPIVSDAAPSLASVWEDFDNDGDLDCYVTNGQSFAARYYANAGGTFVSLELGSLTGAGPHWGASAGDYDADGFVDLYVNGNTTTHGLYRNVTVNGNRWLGVRLHGELSNRSGIGARVYIRSTITGATRLQMREISTQNSFDGMNRLGAHFGLADGTQVDSLIVEWPSGSRTVVTDVAVDRVVDIEEQGGVTAVAVSLVESSAIPGRVRIVWALASFLGQFIGVERAGRDGAWIPMAGGVLDGRGYVTFEDSQVAAETRYRYHLVLRVQDVDQRVGETEAQVPAAHRLAIRSIDSSPGAGPIRVEFELPVAEAAELDLYDLTGRRVDSWRSMGGPAGLRAVELGDGRRMTSGVYWVRLRQNGGEVTARVARLQ